jgi:hypothetical protein
MSNPACRSGRAAPDRVDRALDSRRLHLRAARDRLVFIAALDLDAVVTVQVVDAWGSGFWDLIPFTLQMSLIIITGHVLATSAPMGRRFARSPAGRRRRAARWRWSRSSRCSRRGSTGASA